MKKLKFILAVIALVFLTRADAQPFAEDIAAFQKQDSLHFPGTGKILFVGSSSFTMWKDVQDYFPAYPIINRGFGGSTLTDVIYYAGQVIFPYQPKQIVIYCGENDFAANDSLYPAQVAERFEKLFGLIREHFPKVPVMYISMKPSPSRKNLMAKFNVANVMIKSFLRGKKRTKFIDVYHAMLQKDGSPMEDIFLEDKLHMNSKGYAIWQKLLEPYLVK